MKTKVGTYNLLRVSIGFVGGTPTHCQVELNRSSIPRVEFFGGKGRRYVLEIVTIIEIEPQIKKIC